jgi:2'-5' RNA ligase
MYGIVSLLDDKHHELVNNLWSEFKARFGVDGVHTTPIPHFSYHVAENYDLDRLGDMLQQAATEQRPFRVRTSGLGLFTGSDPVLYVPVIRSETLLAMHFWLYDALNAIATNPVIHYRADRWLPHITLAHRDVDHELMPQVIRLLTERDFEWEIVIDNLAVLDGENELHTLWRRFPFGS